MKEDDQQPETKPAGNRPPPRPPRSGIAGLAPEDDSDSRRFGKNFRATVANRVKGEGRFTRQSGGRAHYGHVQLQIEPNKRGKGIEIIYKIPDDMIPASYTKPIVEGVRIALEGEMAIGGQVVDENCISDILVNVVGGSFDQTDSNDLAFKMAGIFAVKDALKKTEPVRIG
jgi:elongation factor G